MVTSVPSPVNVVLDLPEHLRVHSCVHVSKVKRWEEDRHWEREDMVPIEVEDGQEYYVFEPERIIGKRGTGARVRYLVKYRGWDHCENQWLPVRELGAFRDMIAAFERREAARQQ